MDGRPGPAVAIGEIRTGLLSHSGTLPRGELSKLLDLVPGEPVRHWERPIGRAVSPDLANGVDCLVPMADNSRLRAVGTVLTHAVVTGGRVLQTASMSRIDGSGSRLRRPWSHYTAQPGLLETVGPVTPGELLDGYLDARLGPEHLDLGAVSNRLSLRLQQSPQLDKMIPLRFTWTRLRWVARLDSGLLAPATPAAQFYLNGDSVRSLKIWAPGARLADLVDLCLDLALHDWILSTLTQRINQVDPGAGDRSKTIEKLRPVIDHLLHLWMPGAQVDRGLMSIWTDLERRPGFSRQWDSSVNRVRDQVSLHTLQLLGDAAVR
ncbi:MAG TPA: SCO2521 family protein [Actinocrinis sp.]|nr:SCO2521 family protein [Actinocrinis sp.]